MKKILILSDLHCGHAVGLTPPGWHIPESPERGHTANKLSQIQKACWLFYESKIKQFGPFDVVFVNGDCIDGRGERSGGLELVEPNRQRQCDMAVVAIRKGMRTKNTPVIMTYGTAYHTGQEEDWEAAIASNLNAKIGSHEWVDVEGVMFDLKHHCGSSSIPHGRFTAQARERLWNQLWALRGQNPQANAIIRSHVHYFNYCGGENFVSLTTPALQGWGTKYGARRCSGTVDFGFIVFEVDKGQFSWREVLMKDPVLQAQPIQL